MIMNKTNDAEIAQIKKILERKLKLDKKEAVQLNNLLAKSLFFKNLNIKNLQYVEELKDIAQIDVGVTDSCNLQCRYCSADADWIGHSKSAMSFATFKNIINVLFLNSIRDELLIVFRGGEPLLRPISWYEQAIDYAQNKAKEAGKSIRFTYSTNATLIDEKWIKFFEKHNLSVCFSMDGTPEIHDKIRGKGEKTVKAIKMLKESKVGDKIAGITVVSKVNYDKMPSFFKFLLGLGIRATKLNICYPIGRTITTQWLTPEQYLKAKIDTFFTMLELDLKIVDPNLLNQVQWFFQSRPEGHYSCENMYCGAGRTFIFVDPRGDITACDRAYQDLPKMGNVNKKINLKKYRETASLFHLKDLSYEECTTCRASRICTFGCTAYTYVVHNNKRDLFDCEYNRKLYDFLSTHQSEAKLLFEKCKSSQ